MKNEMTGFLCHRNNCVGNFFIFLIYEIRIEVNYEEMRAVDNKQEKGLAWLPASSAQPLPPKASPKLTDFSVQFFYSPGVSWNWTSFRLISIHIGECKSFPGVLVGYQPLTHHELILRLLPVSGVSSRALGELESGLDGEGFETWNALNLSRTQWNKHSLSQESSACQEERCTMPAGDLRSEERESMHI